MIAIRQSSNQLELEFILEQEFKLKELLVRAIQVMDENMQTWTAHDHGLVFAAYLGDGQTLAVKVGDISILVYAYTNMV